MRLSAIILTSLVLGATSVGAVDYIRLSPSEFAEDLVKASELAHNERYDEAIALLRVLVDDEPDDADALSLLGYSLRKLGQLDAAEHFYLRALDVAPEHLGANQYLGELYVQRGEFAKARTRLDLLDAVCGDTCDGRDALAEALEAAGQ
jgi:Flp pilus assembly protein TadD